MDRWSDRVLCTVLSASERATLAGDVDCSPEKRSAELDVAFRDGGVENRGAASERDASLGGRIRVKVSAAMLKESRSSPRSS